MGIGVTSSHTVKCEDVTPLPTVDMLDSQRCTALVVVIDEQRYKSETTASKARREVVWRNASGEAG